MAYGDPTAGPRQRKRYSTGVPCEAVGRRGVGQVDEATVPFYHDPHFTFRFADDRLIPRFHLEGAEAGRRVDLPKPIIVRAGEALFAVPGDAGGGA